LAKQSSSSLSQNNQAVKRSFLTEITNNTNTNNYNFDMDKSLSFSGNEGSFSLSSSCDNLTSSLGQINDNNNTMDPTSYTYRSKSNLIEEIKKRGIRNYSSLNKVS
jgi:hypothetical protein